MRPTRKTPTRLEVHRLKFHQAKRKGPLMTFAELTPAEARLVMNDVFSAMVLSGSRVGPYGVYNEVLSKWGIVCPHPASQRRGHEEGGHFRCESCRCISAERWRR